MLKSGRNKVGPVASQTIYIGYCCPVCSRRLIVFSSSSPESLKDLAAHEPIESKCVCGFERLIWMTDIQWLDTWRETETPEVA